MNAPLIRATLPAHAPFSPSAMARILACPGSVKACEAAPPERTESPYAAEGTRAHAIAEALLLREDLDGLPDADNAETVAAVKVYVDYCEEGLDLASRYGIEDRLVISRELFGSCDCWFLVDKELTVVDYKHGRGVTVSAEENKQLLTYAALILADDMTGVTVGDVDEVRLVVVQPRGQGDAISEWTCDINRVISHMQQVAHAMAIAKSPYAPLAIGDHCRFCRAKVSCPAMLAAARGVADLDPRDLPAEEIGERLKLAHAIEAWVAAVYQYAEERMEAGERVPGWKLVAKRATRRWLDEKAVEALAKRQGLLKRLFTRSLITPAAAAKVLGPKIELFTQLIEAKSAGVTVAPESDKRPAVENIGAAMAALGNRIR